MRLLASVLAVFLSVGTLAFGQSETKRYLYLSMPDGAQKEGRSGNGILIFDIDNGHKFVRRIPMPIFEEGLRGFAGNLKTHRLYYSSTNRRLGAFDLETEKVVWEKTYDGGCDRSSVTMDGKKIYVPTRPSRFRRQPQDPPGLLLLNQSPLGSLRFGDRESRLGENL